ncbi:MAG: hypothetical protein N3A38_15710, partial [Planctomycetota bacterium]|nr:hypothetical protein [Planctomycetota bacterium]
DLEALKAGRKPALAAAFKGRSSIQLPDRGGAPARIAGRLPRPGDGAAAPGARVSAGGSASSRGVARAGLPPWAVILASAAAACLIGLAVGILFVTRRGGDGGAGAVAEVPAQAGGGAAVAGTREPSG